ncbi:MAG TPA: hypothetical protein VGB04_02130 [Allosphingosinicella sp.]
MRDPPFPHGRACRRRADPRSLRPKTDLDHLHQAKRDELARVVKVLLEESRTLSF